MTNPFTASTTTRYRRILAYILIPEDYVNPLCPASCLGEVLHHNEDVECGVYRAVFADNDIYDECGQVVEKGADAGTMLMAKIGPGVHPNQATFKEPYLGTIELFGLGTSDEATRTDLARSTHPDHDWTDWDCPTVGCSDPDFTWGGMEGDNVVCVSCMGEWLPEELEGLCI